MKLIFILYFVAQLIHTFSRAGLSAKKEYTPWNSIRQYFAIHWPQLMAQYFLSIALLLMVWDNDKIGGLLALPAMSDTPYSKYGLAIILGWFSDSFLDKLLGFFNLDRKPPRPEDETKDPVV